MTTRNAITVVSLIALVFAGLAAWGVYTFLQKETHKSASVGGVQKVVVAAADLQVGTKVDATQTKVVDWPKESAPPGSFPDSKAVEGRTLVRQVNAGEAITEAKLIPKDGAPGAGLMTYLVPKGHRAVTVAVNEVAGVAGFLNPHNRVDVVVTTIPPWGKDPVSKIILQDVPILATGQTTEQKDGKPVVVPTVTLDLVPDDAEKLVLAASKGSLQLLLRNVVDTDPVAAKGATITKVLGGSSTPAVPAKTAAKKVAKVKVVQPAPAPAAVAPPPGKPYTVEVIKGNAKSTREFAAEQ